MTEWVIVADSSPLIGLARIGQLEILHKLASRVVTPPAVQDEVTLHRREAPGAAAIRQATWIEVEAPDHLEVEPLAILLDRGEAEAIALARRLPSATLLLDDASAPRRREVGPSPYRNGRSLEAREKGRPDPGNQAVSRRTDGERNLHSPHAD